MTKNENEMQQAIKTKSTVQEYSAATYSEVQLVQNSCKISNQQEFKKQAELQVLEEREKRKQQQPRPSTGPKIFWACPNFLCHTKKLFTYCGSQKHFVPDKKIFAFSKIGLRQNIQLIHFENITTKFLDV